MKKTFLIFLISCSSLLSIAQQTGRIIYDEVTKLEIHFPAGMEVPNDFPSENVVTRALYFTESESLYKNIPQEEHVNTIESEGLHLEIKNEIAEDEYYKNLAAKTKTEKRDFLGRQFLMSGELQSFKWKIEPEQKKLLGQVVQKATTTMDTLVVIAWFALQIPVPNGPDQYGQLPGIILEVEIPQNNRTIIAREILLEEPSEPIEPPKKGKKVTDEAFQQIKAEKLAEMRAQYGGKGGVFIQIDEN